MNLKKLYKVFKSTTFQLLDSSGIDARDRQMVFTGVDYTFYRSIIHFIANINKCI